MSETDLKANQKQQKKTLQLMMNQEDDNKFFSRLLSKETSMANPSFRVYYGSGGAGSIPFIWESQPGTPKHRGMLFSESLSLPPLTPPPSSFRSPDFSEKDKPITTSDSAFRRLLKKIGLTKSSGRTSWSAVKPTDYKRRFSNRGSSFDSVFIADDEEEHVVLPGSSYFCFRFGKRSDAATTR